MTREQMIEVMKSAGNVTTKQAEAQLLALEAAGQRVVPVRSDYKMDAAGRDAMIKICDDFGMKDAEIVWDAMLSAAPGAPHE